MIYTGDDELDLFVFLGTPKQVLEEYTAVTGRSPVPPLWSFGLWMSRITYNSEAQVRDVAKKLREHKIPGRRDPPRHRLVQDRLAVRLQVRPDAVSRSRPR